MLDYVDHIRFCLKLQGVLQEQTLWPEINAILSKYQSQLRCIENHILQPFSLALKPLANGV